MSEASEMDANLLKVAQDKQSNRQTNKQTDSLSSPPSALIGERAGPTLVHSKYVAVTTSLLARPYGQQGHPRMRISQELFKQKLSNKFLSLTIFTQNMWKTI